MGWPTIDDQRLPRGVSSFGVNPPTKKTARAESVADGFHTIRGPWWCRDLHPSYVTDFVWNPINATLFVDLSALTDLSWMYSFPTGCASTRGFTPATAFPAGQPVAMPYWTYTTTKCWRYQLDVATPSPGKRIEVVCGRIENLNFANFPPICYALGIFVTPFSGGYGSIWFGLKSGDTPRGDYVMMCTNSAKPVGWNNYNGEMRVHYQTGGGTPTHQLCPCNIEYTPQILSFTVT